MTWGGFRTTRYTIRRSLNMSKPPKHLINMPKLAPGTKPPASARADAGGGVVFAGWTTAANDTAVDHARTAASYRNHRKRFPNSSR